MNRTLQAKFDEIEKLIDEVESDTENVSRAELREFLGSLGSSIEVREDALGPEKDDPE
jgi:hypothetical protein